MRNSKEFLVTTVSGKQLLRNKCRYIGKEYHEIGFDCFFMPDARWHRINNGQIEFDHEVKTYVLLNQNNLYHGIVAVEKDGTIKQGYFSPNKWKNIVFDNISCISEEILEGKNVIEELSTGNYFTAGSNKEKLSMKNKGIRNRYSFSLDYSASPKIDEFLGIYKKLKGEKDNPICRFSKELEGKSFGMEFETSNGFIPERKIFKHGLIPLRDGSLRHDGIEPFEFTTIPLVGDNGINNIAGITEILQKYTEIDHRCSLHVHIGGYKQSMEFVVGMHRLMIRIQDEMYSMFPSNYRFTSLNKFKAKDYCSPIKNIKIMKSSNIEDNFLRLYNYYCNSMESFKGFSMAPHPMDRDERHKWQIELRYYLVNIIPFIWGNSGTIEWRLHPPTQNLDKILNWLFICNGILKYVENNSVELANFCDLKSINLDAIMKSVYSKEASTRLSNYIEWRKKYMLEMDERGMTELINDLSSIPRNCSLLC